MFYITLITTRFEIVSSKVFAVVACICVTLPNLEKYLYLEGVTCCLYLKYLKWFNISLSDLVL